MNLSILQSKVLKTKVQSIVPSIEHMLDSDCIPKFLEIFKIFEISEKNLSAILLNIKNDAYTRILDAWACFGPEKSSIEILKLDSGSKTFFSSFRAFKTKGTEPF